MLSLKTLASFTAIGLALAAAPAFADTTVSSNSGAISTASVVLPVPATPTAPTTSSASTTPSLPADGATPPAKTERPLDAKADGRHLGERHHEARHERHERIAEHREHRHHHHQVIVAHDSRPLAHHYHPVVISTAAGGSAMVEPHHQAHSTVTPVIHHVTHVAPARVAMAPVSGK